MTGPTGRIVWIAGLKGMARVLPAVTLVAALVFDGCGWRRNNEVSAAQVEAAPEARLQYPGSTVVKREVQAERRGGVMSGAWSLAANAGAYMKAPVGVAQDDIREFYRKELVGRGWLECAQLPQGGLKFCRGERKVVTLDFSTNPDSAFAGVGPGLPYNAFYHITSKQCPPTITSCPPKE